MTFNVTAINSPVIYLFDNEYNYIEVLQPDVISTGHDYINASINLNEGQYHFFIAPSYSEDITAFHNIINSNQTSILNYNNINLLAYNEICELNGCGDYRAINYNPLVNVDNGTCLDFIDFGTLSCGVTYQYDSDTLIYNTIPDCIY